MKFYSGIGSRDAPQELSSYIKLLAHKLDNLGYVLRSGAANGADNFFESGAINKEIYLPWPAFNGRSGANYFVFTELPKDIQNEAINIAKEIHPNWSYLTSGAKLLHARNALQCLGLDLKTPSKFLICWTPGGKITGGSATAINLSLARNIPVFNLGNKEDKERVDKWLN